MSSSSFNATRSEITEAPLEIPATLAAIIEAERRKLREQVQSNDSNSNAGKFAFPENSHIRARSASPPHAKERTVNMSSPEGVRYTGDADPESYLQVLNRSPTHQEIASVVSKRWQQLDNDNPTLALLLAEREYERQTGVRKTKNHVFSSPKKHSPRKDVAEDYVPLDARNARALILQVSQRAEEERQRKEKWKLSSHLKSPSKSSSKRNSSSSPSFLHSNMYSSVIPVRSPSLKSARSPSTPARSGISVPKLTFTGGVENGTPMSSRTVSARPVTALNPATPPLTPNQLNILLNKWAPAVPFDEYSRLQAKKEAGSPETYVPELDAIVAPPSPIQSSRLIHPSGHSDDISTSRSASSIKKMPSLGDPALHAHCISDSSAPSSSSSSPLLQFLTYPEQSSPSPTKSAPVYVVRKRRSSISTAQSLHVATEASSTSSLAAALATPLPSMDLGPSGSQHSEVDETAFSRAAMDEHGELGETMNTMVTALGTTFKGTARSTGDSQEGNEALFKSMRDLPYSHTAEDLRSVLQSLESVETGDIEDEYAQNTPSVVLMAAEVVRRAQRIRSRPTSRAPSPTPLFSSSTPVISSAVVSNSSKKEVIPNKFNSLLEKTVVQLQDRLDRSLGDLMLLESENDSLKEQLQIANQKTGNALLEVARLEALLQQRDAELLAANIALSAEAARAELAERQRSITASHTTPALNGLSIMNPALTLSDRGVFTVGTPRLSSSRTADLNVVETRIGSPVVTSSRSAPSMAGLAVDNLPDLAAEDNTPSDQLYCPYSPVSLSGLSSGSSASPGSSMPLSTRDTGEFYAPNPDKSQHIAVD